MKNLKYIEINIGKVCNSKRKFGANSNSALFDVKFVKFDKLQDTLISCFNNGYRSVGFSGGDVSDYPKMEKLFILCKKLGFIEIHAITNAIPFSDYNLAKKAVDAGLTMIHISIYSHKSSIDNFLTQIPNGLEKKIKAIQNFQDLYNKGLLKSQVSINFVLNQKNYTSILETMLFYNRILFISDIRINFIGLDDIIKHNGSDLTLSYTEFLPYLKKLIYISLKENIKITFNTIPPCIFYLVDCKNYSNIIKRFIGEDLDHITEIDGTNNYTNLNGKNKNKDVLKAQFKQCYSCFYKNSCQGVWKDYGELYGGNEFVPIKNIYNRFIVEIDSNKAEVINKEIVIKKTVNGSVLRAYKNNKYILLYVYSNQEDSKHRHFEKFIIKIVIDINNNFNVIGILFGKEIDLAWIIKDNCLQNFLYDGNNISGMIKYNFTDNKLINKLGIYGKFNIAIEQDILDDNYLNFIPNNPNILKLDIYKDNKHKFNKYVYFVFGYQPILGTDQYTFITNKNSLINGINYRFIEKDINISISNNKITYFFINIENNHFFITKKEIKKHLVKSIIDITIVDEYNRKIKLDLELNILNFNIHIKGEILAKYYNTFH